MDGLLVINKPSGRTSRAVVDRAEAWFPGARVGHAGTLDPLATGVLVIAAGEATRLIEYVQRMPKTYEATIRLGARSDTDDADGVVTAVDKARHPPEEEVRACLQGWVGVREQRPPAHSAAHVDGRRAYRLARAGQPVELKPRPVHIHAIELLEYSFPVLRIRVRSGKGTYIRSLARDVGEELGCGGLIQALDRSRIGPFGTEDAQSMDMTAEEAQTRLQPSKLAVSELPAVVLSDELGARLRHGQRVPIEWAGPDDTEVAVFGGQGAFVAVAIWDAKERRVRPVKVMHGSG